MKRRERKKQVDQVLAAAFAGIDLGDDGARAEAVRNLCPCRGAWTVSLWEFIFAACADPSPYVRKEALHVIEDAVSQGVPNAHGRRFLWRATQDADPEVRGFAEEAVLRMDGTAKKRLKKYNAKRHLAKRKRPR